MLDRTVSLVAAVATLVLVAGFVALSFGGYSTEAYVLFVSGPVVSGTVGVILSKKVNAVQETADVVKEHVNGMMSGRFTKIDDTLAEQTELAEEIALRPVTTTLSPDPTTLTSSPTTLSPRPPG